MIYRILADSRGYFWDDSTQSLIERPLGTRFRGVFIAGISQGMGDLPYVIPRCKVPASFHRVGPGCQYMLFREPTERAFFFTYCPKCQPAQAQQWLERQQAFLLPVPYFLLTFTLPAQLRPLARQHQRLLYHLLFRASAMATQQLARDPRFIGGQIGLVGVLHTWTRDLQLSLIFRLT